MLLLSEQMGFDVCNWIGWLTVHSNKRYKAFCHAKFVASCISALVLLINFGSACTHETSGPSIAQQGRRS